MVLLFWAAFVATVIALGAVVYTGVRRRRRAHYKLVAVFVALLAVTIYLTEAMLREVKFPEAELAFHLKFAMAATLLLAPVLLTGLAMARYGGRWRIAHRVAVVVFVVAVLIATGTGIRAFSLAV